jgi:hypothetical protein
MAVHTRRLKAAETCVPHVRQLATWGDAFFAALSETLTSQASSVNGVRQPSSSLSSVDLLIATVSSYNGCIETLQNALSVVIVVLRRSAGVDVSPRKNMIEPIVVINKNTKTEHNTNKNTK